MSLKESTQKHGFMWFWTSMVLLVITISFGFAVFTGDNRTGNLGDFGNGNRPEMQYGRNNTQNSSDNQIAPQDQNSQVDPSSNAENTVTQ